MNLLTKLAITGLGVAVLMLLALRVARKGARYAREPAPQPCRRGRR